jgi:hypothetical protein
LIRDFDEALASYKLDSITAHSLRAKKHRRLRCLKELLPIRLRLAAGALWARMPLRAEVVNGHRRQERP